ncbi:MAG: response regulator [Peptococcaceae bacterium]|nr:response regulator [Peptococcaceae bacterium]
MTKILVLEDEPSIRSFIMINLKKNNFEIVETASGEEALEKLDETVDIALLDVMLPGISGFEVCKRAREQYPSLGIIPAEKPVKVVRDVWRQKDLSSDELNCTIPLHGCRYLKVSF